jgi:starch-binding outer membrane protein, SusD/RagB family
MVHATSNNFRSYLSILHLLLFSVVVTSIACKKLVEVPPPTDNIGESNIYAEDATAIATLTAIYTNMTNVYNPAVITGNQSISLLCGLSADELTLYGGVTNRTHLGYYKNDLKATPTTLASGSEHWAPFYGFIFRCNAAIEGLNQPIATSLNPKVRRQLMGEAKFLRAFFYFYLVNLYGDVPLALTTDYKVNSHLARNPTSEVYQQIVADLSSAQELLADEYVDALLLNNSDERLRPTKWAASSLLSRVYLYYGDYVNAEKNATIVIGNTGLFSLPPLNEVFLKNSSETIWQVQPTTLYFNTEEARTFIIPPTGFTDGTEATNPVYISSQLLNSFEAGDQRVVTGNWVDTINLNANTYYYPYKYKNNTQDISITSSDGMSEYLMVLRLGEQYLIRAEARAQLNDIAGAQSDLNAIRTRAGLPNTLASDQSSLLVAILHERQVELFTEWGHRWMDLKRTGMVDAVMSLVTPLKANGEPWRSYQQWYPLPQADLEKAPNLAQNNNY